VPLLGIRLQSGELPNAVADEINDEGEARFTSSVCLAETLREVSPRIEQRAVVSFG